MTPNQTDEERIDELLSKHLNEIKAGHDDKLKQSLLEMIREARIDELNRWFDMPKHYPGEEYRDQPFAQVKCKTPGRTQYQLLDSRFTYALKTHLAELQGLSNKEKGGV